jgi:hypothetical protein
MGEGGLGGRVVIVTGDFAYTREAIDIHVHGALRGVRAC